MRYFLELAYNGSRFCGYQIQPNGYTIQEDIEKALAVILRRSIKIVGCGRTDTGVHAAQFFAHFDWEEDLGGNFLHRLNTLTSKDIVFDKIIKVADKAHARFDATSRSYRYHIDLRRNPFRQEVAYYCPYGQKLEVEKMQKAADLLLQFDDFTTFCKSRTDTKTNICKLQKASWRLDEQNQQLIFQITADRFLRGMIRLIVGMSLYVGQGKIELAAVEDALKNKKLLKTPFSAPAKGLFLMDIKYNFL